MGEARILLRDAADLTATVPAEVERKLTVLELLWNDGFVRKTVIILFLAAAWEAYGTVLDNPLLFPTFHDTILTMFEKVRDGTIPMRAWASLKVLFMGYAAGIILAAIFTILAISTRIGTDFLETITAMFNPLAGDCAAAAGADLVRARQWQPRLRADPFGAVAGRAQHPFRLQERVEHAAHGRPQLRPARPALRRAHSDPGGVRLDPDWLKIGWAFAWRTLIAAELVFGVSSGQGGLGWFIFENRNLLDIPAVFAGLLTVIVIGLIVENLIFRTIERNTVQKWGTQS